MLNLEDVNSLTLSIKIDKACLGLLLRESQNSEHTTIGLPIKVPKLDDVAFKLDFLMRYIVIIG